MAEETKTHFTFSFFDAAHTDGYVAPTTGPTKEFKRSDNQLTCHQQGKGFFSDEEEDEDIVTTIRHWKQTSSKESKTKPPQQRGVHDLFAEPAKESVPPESDGTIPVASYNIQLNRLLDDYMLGEKGDRIMQQMEDLTMDDTPSPAKKPKEKSHSQQNDIFTGDQKTSSEPQEPSLDLGAMMSMEDFEKYIAEN
ncbi:hypothetical protein PHYPSEUDO_007453 [Phytophthora pseudosyringae]|uniref:Uncharacterized protein n=1 Tax=Phytophthora pseudosyringae TaxID=221518 RepID=A0A8T1WJK7_9STRA|nr:hypothetical protein PHYPSEUDO_007453 [Phytophthora pseudosyringae]